MRRLHLFEFGDLRWFPHVLREAETAYLATSYRMLPILARRWAEKISSILPPGEPAEILDLCSGSGGAMPLILAELQKLGHEARAGLTDLYPNPKSAAHPGILWVEEPVDATRVPANLAGVRTMFAAFHHFRPAAAKAILKDAFDQRRSICIFEPSSGGLLGVAGMAGVPLAVLALMPFARPFRWEYLAFTYLIPLMPMILLWDGMVSVFRIYSPAQMKHMTEDLQAARYVWDIGSIQVRGIPGGLPYLIGHPIPWNSTRGL